MLYEKLKNEVQIWASAKNLEIDWNENKTNPEIANYKQIAENLFIVEQ